MKALLIDDSKLQRTIVRHMLIDFGFQVYESENGLDGVELLRQIGRPDLVLVDLNMPVMDGLEFVAAVCGPARLKTFPVVVMSAASEMSAVGEVLAAGADDYLIKPFDRESLRSKLPVASAGNADSRGELDAECPI